jgi:hypothetical protein
MTDQAMIARFRSEIARCFPQTKQESNMGDYDNTNRGVLFNERDKKTKDGDRDYSGSINIEGTEYWLSAWIKVSKKTGGKFLSLSVKPKVEKLAASNKSLAEDLDDEIPF